jgi:hypothetical protein
MNKTLLKKAKKLLPDIYGGGLSSEDKEIMF